MSNTLRPARSTSAADANVIKTWTIPTMRVQMDGGHVVPAAVKMDCAKKITALIPENCWKNINITQMKKPFRLAFTANKSRMPADPLPADSNSFLMAWIALLALQNRPQNHFIAVAASASRR